VKAEMLASDTASATCADATSEGLLRTGAALVLLTLVAVPVPSAGSRVSYCE
jgi:hypothetical protein